MPFDGVLFGPSGSDQVFVSVRVTGSWLEIRGAGETLRIDAAKCEVVAAGWNRESVQIAWSGEGGRWALLSKDPALRAELAPVAQFRAALGEVEKIQATARRSGRLALTLISILTLIPILILVGLFLVRDRIVDAVLARIPITVDQEIGMRFEREILGASEVLGNGEAARAIDAIVGRLKGAIPKQPFDFRVRVQRNKEVNAFAAPGGLIVVTTGLIEAAGSAEEVAGVLAHEMAHATRRHSMRQLIYAGGVLPLMGLLIGRADGAALFQNLGRLSELKFSRAQEEDADQTGFETLRAASISTEGMAAFFDRLAQGEGAPPSFLSTHPSSASRATTLRERARARNGSLPAPLPIDWKMVKASITERAERP